MEPRSSSMVLATSRMLQVISSMALVVSSTLAAMGWTFSATSSLVGPSPRCELLSSALW